MKNRSPFSHSFCAQLFCGLFIAFVTLGLTSCDRRYYDFPQFNFANRPVPPSRLSTRVMVSLTINGSQGALQMLDAQRDIRNNIFNPNSTFPISGYSSGYPRTIFNFPEQVSGYVYSSSDGSLTQIDYSKEAVGTATSKVAINSDSTAVPRGSDTSMRPPLRQVNSSLSIIRTGGPTPSIFRTSIVSQSIRVTLLSWPWCATRTHFIACCG